ncbi:hypothetical protein B0A49_13882, partial [Cryomyces minteri]
RKFYESVGTDIAAESAMSARRKKLATRATQSSQEDVGTDVDMQDEIEVADSSRASSRARKPSQKARESEAVDLVGIAEVLGSLQGQIKQLLDANKRTDEANKRFEEANKRSEEANRQLRDENKELKDMIKGLKLDIENMKAYSPYWGPDLISIKANCLIWQANQASQIKVEVA